jgi:MoCo/4Fe-4S cofactor protein with predicted Tat translocation signal
MKHIFQHPPEMGTAKAYWRSVEDFAHTEQFQGWLNREFPQGASEFWGDGVSRRSFLRLMGASMALAGLGLSACRRPEAHIVPFVKTPEWQIPGRTLNYATSMPRRGGGVPLLATSIGGRPIKMEGNPLHPLSKGKSDTFAQSSILDLYDPDRAHRFVKKGSQITQEEFIKDFEVLKQAWKASSGRGLAILAEDNSSPTEDRLRRELALKYPGSVWTAYEPARVGHDRTAAETAYGKGAEVRNILDKATVVFSLDSDFLGDESTLSGIRGFTSARRVENTDSVMNRLYAVESRYTVTGGMADHRLRLPASRMVAVAVAVAHEIGVKNLPAFSALPEAVEIDPVWIREAAQDLLTAGNRALVVAGAGQSVQVHLLVLAINEALGARGTTFTVIRQDRPASVSFVELAEKIRGGEVTDLLILGSNPVYNAPADTDWVKLQKSLRNVIRLGFYEDETSEMSGWHLPQAHYLEAWGDALLQDGSYGCVQPMILPLYGGLTSIQLLGLLLDVPVAAGKGFVDGPELVQTTFKEKAAGTAADFENNWNLFVRDGFLQNSEAKAEGIAFALAGAALLAQVGETAPPRLSKDCLEIVFVTDSKVDDGRYINNGWLQEAPDIMTKLTWDNAALMSARTAQDLGIYSGVEVKGIVAGLTDGGIYHSDIITITVDGRSLNVPFLIVPGHPDFTITLPLGYGHEKTGRVGQGVGFNAYKLRSSQSPYVLTGATIAKTALKRHEFAITQEHWSMEGRDIVREAPIAYFKENTGFVKALGIESHTPDNKSFYKSPPFDYEKYHQWGMVVDLTTCVGCNACTIACQSENNIAIVGKDQVKKGREMHWIRIDRYFAGSQRDIEMGKGVIPSDPEVVLQPVMCMQCENAPCETVCPVNATVHNEEGLNVMAYNRCIGTRYCANNCPYKVRRFNWFDYNQRQIDQLYWGPLGPKGVQETVKMSKNPNVTVRMRGVMEKCTFCVQRIETAKIDHKVATQRTERKIPTDSLQVACQQACPADAIVFGDLSDPESRVHKLKKHQLNYSLLDYLNTKPRLTYLAKIRNPNPKMPGAELVGMSLVNSRIHSHGGHEVHETEAVGHDDVTHPVEKAAEGHSH